MNKPGITIEICIEASTVDNVRRSAAAAKAGGAGRIELCAEMSRHGLTPQPELIRVARAEFPKPGLLVMVRPRSGDFCYLPSELAGMQNQIEIAAACGADGVVLGALKPNGELAKDELKKLIDSTKCCGLSVGFHRAFDAIPDRLAAIHVLAELGADRVLTSGIRWGQQGTALDGYDLLQKLAIETPAGLELVIGGGVSVENIAKLASGLQHYRTGLSFHAFSAAYDGDCVRANKVRAIVEAANSSSTAG